MRRDMDLIRELLLKLEALPLEAMDVKSIRFDEPFFVIEGYSNAEVIYHLGLILEAGLTEPPDNQGMASFTFSGLSWRGHDFIDSVRDPKIWRDTKSVLKTAGGYTVDMMVAAAKALVKGELKKHGLDLG